jgi:acetolactate synthase-1/2/3 large subunit
MGETGEIIAALASAMQPLHPGRAEECARRRKDVAERSRLIRQKTLAAAEAGGSERMSKAWVSLCLSEAIREHRATVLSELGCPLDRLTLDGHGTWYQEPHSGGLGWSFPTALGIQLADPDRLVIATMGDGSYMFANPGACHQIAEALELPVLVLILNNAEWGAVRQSVLGVYPNGYAPRANAMPLTSLAPSPDFTKVAEASRAWTARVERAADLTGVLKAAIEHVTTRRTQALVDISIAP